MPYPFLQVADAAQKVHMSKIFDNATSCSSENSVIIHEQLFDKMVAEFRRLGGYLCSEAEKTQLQNWLWVPDKKGHLALNAKIVGQPAAKIAEGAGLNVPAGTTI
jgi:sulfoacetaldehyde dehydrogenase